MYILYIYCTNWLKVISWQEQIGRLLVVIHFEKLEKLRKISIFKFPQAKSEIPEHKNGKKNI